MDLMARQGTFFTPTIAFLPTWYATYPPVYVPELHDRYEGTLVEKELQRNYDCLREAKRRGVVMTIGSDSFSFVTPYGTCTIEEMYEFVDKIGFTPVETITCATLNGAKMAHVDNVTGSLEVGKCADLLVVNGDVAANIHTLNVDNMDVIDEGRLDRGGRYLRRGQPLFGVGSSAAAPRSRRRGRGAAASSATAVRQNESRIDSISRYPLGGSDVPDLCLLATSRNVNISWGGGGSKEAIAA